MGLFTNKKIIILAIFIIALLTRLIAIFFSLDIVLQDADGNAELARNVLEGRGYSIGGKLTSCHPPLYSLFLSSLFLVFKNNYLAVRIIQSLLGAVTCVVIFLISRKIFSIQIAIIGALIACFNPGFIKISQYLRNENLFILILAIAILFLLKQTQKKNFNNLALLGMILGIATMTRDMLILFPFSVLLILGRDLVSRDYNFKKITMCVIIFLIFFLLPILPWTLRNWQVHHRFVLITNKLGMGLYASYVPRDGKIFGYNANDDITQKADLLDSQVEQSNFLAKEALKYIKQNPLKILKLELLKIAFFWSPFDWEIIGYGVYNFMYGFIMPFFIYGLFILRNRYRELLPLYLPIGYTFFIALVTYGSPRFRLPIEPYLIIIASAGVYYFVLKFSKRIYGVLLTSLYFLINFLMHLKSYQVKLFVKSFFEKIHLW